MMRQSLIALGITIGVCGSIGCTSTQSSTTTLTAPSVQKCQVQISTSTTQFPENGGTGSLTLITTRDCSWSAAVSENWIALTNPSGQGEATVSYSVAPNSVPQSRTASISVGEQSVQIVEAAAPCRYTLASATARVGATGGPLAVTLQTLTGCAWTASSDSGWLTLSTTNGNTSATIGLTVAANAGGERVGRALIGGQPYVVTQDAALAPGRTPPPTPPPSPAPTPPSSPAPAPPAPTPPSTPAPAPPAPTPAPSPPPSSPTPPVVSGPGQGDDGDGNAGGNDDDKGKGKDKGKDDGDGKGKK
jgi:hypothetical protein